MLRWSLFFYIPERIDYMQKSDRTTKKTIKSNSRGRCPDGAPNPIDVYVGQRIRTRRLLLGMSQEKFAALMGVSFQQIQKYEKGNNRIGASRLWDISKLLKTDLNFFFEDMPQEIADRSPRSLVQHPDIIDDSDNNPLSACLENTNEAQELLSNYFKIRNRMVAGNIFNLLQILAMAATRTDAPFQE